MTSTDGLSFRIRDLDVLREQVLLVPGADDLVAGLEALDEWRSSIGVPQFPTAEEAAGVTLPMSDEAVEALERLISMLVFGISTVDPPPSRLWFRSWLSWTGLSIGPMPWSSRSHHS